MRPVFTRVASHGLLNHGNGNERVSKLKIKFLALKIFLMFLALFYNILLH